MWLCAGTKTKAIENSVSGLLFPANAILRWMILASLLRMLMERQRGKQVSPDLSLAWLELFQDNF